MDDISNQDETVRTGSTDKGKQSLRGSNTDKSGEDTDDMGLTRRSYLAAAGLTTAAFAGCADRARETVKPVSSFGYGGTPALQQSSSLSVAESEPNDVEANADALTLGATVTATLTVNDGDWYTVDLSKGDDVSIEFTRAGATGVTAVILYDPNGEYSNLRYVSTDEPVVVAKTAALSGTYYIQVVDTQDSDGDYTLTVGTGTTPTETETATPTETETATATDDYGKQRYGEYGYGGITA